MTQCLAGVQPNIQLSIIIPTKNEINTFPALYNCLAKQTYQDYEIIVADDSSDDSIREMCNSLGINCVSGGLPGKARNNGVNSSVGKYILFLDADALIEPLFIEQAMNEFIGSSLDAISFYFVPTTGDYFIRLVHKIANQYFYFSCWVGFPHGLGGALLLKREVHEKNGGFDETITIAEDQDYFKRLSKNHKYEIARNPIVSISTRRFIENGMLRVCAKWILIELHRIIFGEIRHTRIPYFDIVKE